MAQIPILAAVAPNLPQRCAAAALAIYLLLAAALLVPVAPRLVAPLPGFVAAFGPATMLADLITAVMLAAQAVAVDDPVTARLAGAYMFSVFAIIPHLLAFPGVFNPQPIIGDDRTAVWLWTLWHAGFALFVLWYAMGSTSAPPRPVRLMPQFLATAAVVLAGCVFVAGAADMLPRIMSADGRFDPVNGPRIGSVVVMVHLAALAAILLHRRCRSMLDLWLAVTMLAATLDVALTTVSGARFSIGWYAARVLSLVAGVTELCVLMVQVSTLYVELCRSNVELRDLALTDALTLLPNRRAFDQLIAAEWRRARRTRTSLSLLMVDVDLFKRFNDRYGHLAGDRCLREVAAALGAEARRPGDVAARIGGEEFAMLLPQTEAAGAVRVAHRVREAIVALAIPHADSPTGVATVSIGSATLSPRDAGGAAEDLVNLADGALYRAKHTGRNAVAQEQPPAPDCPRDAA